MAASLVSSHFRDPMMSTKGDLGCHDIEIYNQATEMTAGTVEEDIYDPDDLDGFSSGDESDHLDRMVDSFELVENAPKQYTKRMTARRQKRNAEFAQWFGKKKKDLEAEKKLTEQNDELMSARALITSTTKIISQPRDYQLELYEIAKRENTLAVLNTGSGKTLIACLLIRYMINQELEDRSKGHHRRVCMFLVDSVTLVFQQTAVLSCNLDAKIGKYCGDLVKNMMTAKDWKKILDEHEVLVMTGDVLGNCLTHAFIKMKDINLICFDEAHHAKKNHIYARIIREHYLPNPDERKPKIFGMTASPVDAKADIVGAASELESLLHSRIATTSDLTLLQNAVSQPIENIARYKSGGPPWETDLYKHMFETYGKISVFKKIFLFSKDASTELGPWCADHVWRFALTELEAIKLGRKTEKVSSGVYSKEDIQKMEFQIEEIREAQEYIASHEFSVAKMVLGSPKVQLLAKYLIQLFRESDSTQKCIIFVTRRYTARALFGFLETVKSPHMKIGILVGSRGGTNDGATFTFRQQMLNVSRFRRGILNCLIATSVAEEGLDIPDCSSVVRFDLYNTMIQYIQSRGRARHMKSTYIHMIEEGNLEHENLFRDARASADIMRQFCQSLPEDRLMDSDPPGPAQESKDDRVYIEPATGAKVTLFSAMQLISHYVGHLPQLSDDVVQPTYLLRPMGSGAYVCELQLPTTSPISIFEGPPMSTKSGAKRAAAFEACIELRKGGYLNNHLLPNYMAKELPKMANAHLALDINKKNTYSYRAKPSFWNIKSDEPPQMLWIMLINLKTPEKIQDGHNLQRICIGTRKKLPKMPSFPVYGDKGGESEVTLIRLRTPVETPEEKLKYLDTFTERTFSDVFNKVFEYEYKTQPYWIAPVKDGDWDEDSSADDLLDWEVMKDIRSGREMVWDENTPISAFENRFFVDRIQRSRRFAIASWDPAHHPDDPIPEGSATAPGMTSIKDYSYNAGKKGLKYKYVKWKIPEIEPVLVADRFLHRLNYLEPPHSRDINTTTSAYICPSPFIVSLIPMELVYTIMIWPAISTRIDAYLHAWDMCKIVDIDIDLGLALEALTKDSDNTEEHGVEQINLQKGMGKNYERLEFLGDCFLKLGTSISLFSKCQGDDEFKLHVRRMVLICNQHLFEKAKVLSIPEYIQTQGFSRRFWYPAMKLLYGKGVGKEIISKGSPKHSLGDKSIADVCEALIGAAFLDRGLDGATKMVSSILQSSDHTQKSWAEYYDGYEKPAYQIAQPTASQLKLAVDIEEQFKYKFKSPKLLMSSFTHSSNPYSYEKVPCYQRLEFLGDSLLDLACVEYIFKENPNADPQWLTEHKMAMVSNKFLGAVTVTLGLHKKLRKVGAQLDIAIRDYETEILAAKEENSSMSFWTSVGAPPKALPDILEAFVGALFVDSEFNYDLIQQFFDTHIRPYFVDMSLYDDFAGQHPTTFLSKQMTVRGCDSWGYESEQFVGEEETYMVAAFLIHDKVFSFGKGNSVKTARVQASEEALLLLKSMTEEGFAEWCDCKTSKDQDDDINDGKPSPP